MYVLWGSPDPGTPRRGQAPGALRCLSMLVTIEAFAALVALLILAALLVVAGVGFLLPFLLVGVAIWLGRLLAARRGAH